MTRCFQATLIVTAVTLSGCGALPQSIEFKSDGNDVTAKPITVAVQETPPFMFTTPSKALVDGGVAEWVDPEKAPTWKKVTEANQVPDFTEVLRDKFITRAEEQSNATFLKTDKAEPIKDSEDFTRLTAQYDSAYILELRTKSGMFGHGPISWQTMFMNYFADATLVRNSDGQPVWRATCKVRDEDSDLLSLPSADVFDGSGDEFRAAADFATSSCSKQLVTEFIGAIQ